MIPAYLLLLLPGDVLGLTGVGSAVADNGQICGEVRVVGSICGTFRVVPSVRGEAEVVPSVCGNFVVGDC